MVLEVLVRDQVATSGSREGGKPRLESIVKEATQIRSQEAEERRGWVPQFLWRAWRSIEFPKGDMNRLVFPGQCDSQS